MSQPEDAHPVRYGSRYAPSEHAEATAACLMCDGRLPSSRATYCSAAWKQLAFRLRRQRSADSEITLVRQQLKRQRLLATHDLRVPELRRARPGRPKVFNVSAVLPSARAGRQLSRLRHAHLAHRADRRGGGTTSLRSESTRSGVAMPPWQARAWTTHRVAHMPTPDDNDDDGVLRMIYPRSTGLTPQCHYR